MERALLVRLGGLGDLLITLPSIRLIRRTCAEARLTLACRVAYGRLLAKAGVVDEIISEDSPRLLPLFDEDAAAGAKSSGDLGPFDLVVCWTHGGRGHFAQSRIARSAEGGNTFFLSADPAGSNPLSGEFFRKTADAIGASGGHAIEEFALFPAGPIGKAEGSRRPSGGGAEKPRIVVHPGSGSESKRWPLENFSAVIRRLGERGVSGLLVTGEAEEGMEADLEKAILPSGWTRVKQPDLTDLASELREAGLYLGNDSGVTHLAAACGAEVIALFRQDLVRAWKPLGRVHALAAPSLPDIPLESVMEIIVSLLPNFSAYSQNS